MAVSSKIPTVFVAMATGSQGGALARQLRAIGWNVRATVRNPDTPEAKALERAGVHLTLGDWDNEEALRTALTGCSKAFIGFTANLRDPDEAPKRAESLVKIAKEVGVKQAVVTTTLGTGALEPGKEEKIPPTPFFYKHTLSKRRVEKTVEDGFEHWTVVRPGFFMSNFLQPKIQRGYLEILEKSSWTNVLTSDHILGLIDHEDIAKFALAAFQDPAKFHGRRLGLVSEQIPVQGVLDQLAAAVGDGRTIRAHFMSDEEIDAASASGPGPIFQRERCVRYHDILVDVKELESLVPGLTTFQEFLEREKDSVKSTYLTN